MERLIATLYGIGMIGTLLSLFLAATVVTPYSAYWVHGLISALVFAGIWGASTWYGVKKGHIEIRKE